MSYPTSDLTTSTPLRGGLPSWRCAASASACACYGPAAAQQPCQPLDFAAPYPIWGVDSAAGCGCGEVGWDARGMIPWQEFAQGEYVGHARTPHVPEYRLREGDVIAVYYRRTREETFAAVRAASRRSDSRRVADRRPRHIDSCRLAARPSRPTTTSRASWSFSPTARSRCRCWARCGPRGAPFPQLRDELEEQYKKYFRVPSITVTPITVNTKLEDLLEHGR